MVKGNTDVEMKDVSSPSKKEKVEKVNGVAEEEPPKDPDLLTLEGSHSSISVVCSLGFQTKLEVVITVR